MLVQSFFRHVLIPAYESLYQRRKTLKYLADLERTQWLSPGEIAEIQTAALQRMLRHAAETCPYYREAWQAAGLSPADVRSTADFARWPVIGKPEIREHRLTMRSTLDLGKLISKSTGGSTGVPVHIDLDRTSNERRTAAMFRGYGWAGGGPGSKQFHLWGVPLDNRPQWKQWKDKLYAAILRRKMVNSFELSDETAPRILATLNSHRPDVVVAYTGALYQFARMLEERNLKPYSPKSLIVGAEKLHDFQRQTIESVFQAPVFETYGSREFMMIGGECSEHRGLHLTSEQLLVEILDDDGRPTPAGEVGNVVVTDLYNYGMPLIRYAIGDQAIAGFERCTCGRGLPLLRGVTGRKVDSLRTPDGRRVPGAFFPHLMKDFAGIRQFQVVQPTLDRLELRVVLTADWRTDDQQELLARVARTVGPQVDIQWQPVPNIELTKAGKHKVVVSHLAS